MVNYRRTLNDAKVVSTSMSSYSEIRRMEIRLLLTRESDGSGAGANTGQTTLSGSDAYYSGRIVRQTRAEFRRSSREGVLAVSSPHRSLQGNHQNIPRSESRGLRVFPLVITIRQNWPVASRIRIARQVSKVVTMGSLRFPGPRRISIALIQ
jgi:hypothetical protein